jgi:Fe-S-cluster containining protein
MRLCELCKDIQKTCCQNYIKAYLTLGDIERISAASGRTDFVELRPCPRLSAQERSGYDYDPNWLCLITLPGNFNRLLKKNQNGDCVFLGANGCELAEEVRPLICRLYPYSYNEYGLIGLVVNDMIGCPTHLLGPGEEIFKNLHMPRIMADEWRVMLYAELRKEYSERDAI